jgi:Mn2+/Fe2+ NRAMP family transporter
VDKSFKEAPFFYWLYSALIVGGALTVLLLPDAQLINVAILSQVLNGVLLPVVIILMLMLINRKDLMGEYKNSHLWNVIAWGTSLIVIGMTLVMLWGMIPGH